MTIPGILQRLFPSLAKATKVMHTLLIKKGLWVTFNTGNSVQADGGPVPWMTYPALDYLSQLDFSRAVVLEYGSGGGSLWWAQRAFEVTSVESDAEWVKWIQSRAPDNLNLIGPVAGKEYVYSPLESGRSFNVIIVDGGQRETCSFAALPHLAPGGLFILDNSDWYPEICLMLRERGLFEIDFHGFGPANDYSWTTSIFIRAESCLPHLGQRWDNALHGNLVHRA
jgi:SAM-dependent methyltransferase